MQMLKAKKVIDNHRWCRVGGISNIRFDFGFEMAEVKLEITHRCS